MHTLIKSFIVAATLTVAASARAETPDAFIRATQSTITTVLEKPASLDRDAALTAALDHVIDYDALVQRCFKEHWSELDATQRAEVTALVRQLIRRAYRKKLNRSDHETSVSDTSARGVEYVVHTQVRSTLNAREPAVEVDYVLVGRSGSFRIVDIVSEHVSTTDSYYRDFHRILTTDGYAHLVEQLHAKVARPS
jgi:phospholipid transport system substrate-binding protein